MRGHNRRLAAPEPENHERWLVSYADFITLLFAFFVVMYAISNINAGKYRVMAESLEKAFKEKKESPAVAVKASDPIQIGETPRSPAPIQVDMGLAGERVRLARISEQLEEVLAPYIDQDLIAVERNPYWVAVEMKSGMLFPSGSAELNTAADPVIAKLAEVVRQMPSNPVYVEGHTDNVPIHNRRFPSNWELSAARAASVVRRLIRYGVAPRRLAAVGYGAEHPVADNDTAAGRYRNRRVVMVLQSKTLARYPVTGGERQRLLVRPQG
ncbi:chemotaxis protein MotB [Methylomarinovum tepidoasis]|uniref:Chemotaxis protein MotB n=1 Tax=Methylomarinovum tepidoasis TaxID=2840183 RepID=A0AAU9CX01_9GAMM|nr:flagellar motor protein MotD [Methylomarinovum sp. IN45]BCX89215.1 chemotaxis protein MotB [Methylomarinovum sp. IN45]